MNISTSNKKQYTKPRLKKTDPLTEQNLSILYGMDLLARKALDDDLRGRDTSQVAKVLRCTISHAMEELLNLQK